MTDAEALDAALLRPSRRADELEGRVAAVGYGSGEKKGSRWFLEALRLRATLEGVGMLRQGGYHRIDAALLRSALEGEAFARRFAPPRRVTTEVP